MNIKNLSDDKKFPILLSLLEIQITEIRRKEEVEQTLFQWTTSLLLAVFGVIIALAQRTSPLPATIPIKFLATIIVAAPTLLSVIWIFRRSRISLGNAIAIENVQDLLQLFETGEYGLKSPYPKEWEGNLAKGRRKRKTPIYYASVIFIMSACVITAIWLVL